MGIWKKCLAVGLLAAVCAARVSAGPAADFDRGFDIKAAMTAGRDALLPEPRPRSFMNSQRATLDCKTFTFRAGAPQVSPPAILESYVFETVCEGGLCHDNLVRKEKRRVRVALTGDSAILPWEQDVFSVCLKDTSVSAGVVAASHRYTLVKKPGMEFYEVQAAAEGRLKAAPDPMGITVADWGVPHKAGGMELALADKWAGVYGATERAPGSAERTYLKVTVRQAQPCWFDGVVFEKEFLLAPAGLYKIELSEYPDGFRRPLEAGQKYYVQWGFRRDGDISKADFVDGGRTAEVMFQAQ